MEIYHFVNMSVIIGFLTFFLFIIIIFLIFLNKNIKTDSLNIFLNLCILLIIVLINVKYFVDYKSKNISNFEREDLTNLEILHQNNKNKLNGLLTFDIKTQVWWLFKKKKLATIDSSLNSQKHLHNELSYIDALKFLNISKNEFSRIISNKKQGWRYYNNYIRYFSWYKYQANSLITYKNKNDYDPHLLNYIKKSSPTKTMQFIIPNSEHARLVDLFENRYHIYNNKIDIIILKKESLIAQNAKVDSKDFCKLNYFKKFDVYVRKDFENCYD